jgi:hypothetical protein
VEGVTAAESSTPAPQRKPRRKRSINQILLSIPLTLEVVLVYFAGITASGLKAIPTEVATIGGLAFSIALIAAIVLLRFEWGVWVGWVLQVALLATGFILPIMFFVSAIFVAMWIFCFVKARQITNQLPRETP